MIIRGNRRVGLGIGLVDFQALMNSGNSDAIDSWAKVQAQLTAEGAGPDKILGAQLSFTDAFQNLSLAGVEEQLGDTAAQFTLIGHTAAGALTTVEGLVSAVQTGSPLVIAQSFSGTLISAASALGLVSAGVGAAIVGAVGAVLALMQNFWSPSNPPGQEIQPGCFSGNASPAFNVGYLLFQPYSGPGRIDPTSKQWRRFPEPSTHPGWFTLPAGGPTGGITSDGGWAGGNFYVCYSNDLGNPANNWRGIDLAFSDYRYLECEQNLLSTNPFYIDNPSLADFMRSFFAAWKANKEYALNGIIPQPTEQVLLHALRLWNNGHDNSLTIPLVAAQGFLPALEGVCPSDLVPSINYYVEAALSASPEKTLVSADGGSLLLNIGPPKVPNRIALQPGFQTPAQLSQSAAGSGVGNKLLVGAALAGGATVAGIGAYAYLKHMAFSKAAEHFWKEVTKPFRR